MAGDSVLALFDTAAGAIAAALAVQTSINLHADAVPEDRRMRFRIGVHLGDVIEKADGSVYGDGVNIAARLQALAEPGGITVSDAVRGAVRGKVAASFDDQGEQAVKNIAEPVRAFAVRAEGIVPATATQARPAVGQIDLSLPDKPSIAVLPFVNMSGDPEQEYFTDGITEDIITELSRFHSLFVIARNSSFSYKGQSPDIRRVGKELGVRYVLEGSIRKSAQRIRVTGQLIDALSGNHLWAEKYDRVLEDIFAVQEELTRSIVAAIAPHIDDAEREKVHRRRPESLGAYEHAVSALAKSWTGYLQRRRRPAQRSAGRGPGRIGHRSEKQPGAAGRGLDAVAPCRVRYGAGPCRCVAGGVLGRESGDRDRSSACPPSAGPTMWRTWSPPARGGWLRKAGGDKPTPS